MKMIDDGSNVPEPIRSFRAPSAMMDPALTLAEAEDHEGETMSVSKLALAVRRHLWLVLGVAATVFLLAALWTYKADRIYQSVASVRIDDKESSGSLLKGLVALPNFGNGKVMTEMEVLRSRQLAENVARKLNLGLDVTEPADGREALTPLDMPDTPIPAQFTLKLIDANTYSLSEADKKAKYTFNSVVHVGEPFAVGTARLVVARPPETPLPNEIKFRFRSLRDATTSLRKNLAITRPNREAEIVNVQYLNKDPKLAAQVPNMLLDEFLQYKLQSSKKKASSTVGFLRTQVATYDSELKQAESNLGDFREQKQVISLPDEAAAQVKRMAELQVERDRLVAEQRAITEILAKPSAPGETHARDIAAFPSFIANRGIQDILATLLQLETERNALLVRRNPANADVAALTSRIDDLNAQLVQMARGYVSGLDSKIAAVTTNINTFGKQIETIPAREIQYARLARNEKLLEEIATLLNTRLKEAEIEEAIEPGDAQLIDRALVADEPTSPKVGLNLVLGLVVGVGLGFLTGVGRDMMDTKVRTTEDVKSATGGIAILAAIPHFRVDQPNLRILKRAPDAANARQIAPGSGLITLTQSSNASAEAYRALRTNITFAGADSRRQVLVLTSAQAGDGKSTTASNLALTLAQQGVRTLLIDADLRKGVLHKLFSMRREPGLTQLLIGEGTLADAVQVIDSGAGDVPLSVLTAGPYPPNPAELLGSVRMRNLVAEMRQQFDTIIFDTPPLGLVTDAAILGTLADTTILVARAGVTEKKSLQHAATQLYQLGVHVSGTIVNDFDPRQAGYGYEYGYGYAYGSA